MNTRTGISFDLYENHRGGIKKKKIRGEREGGELEFSEASRGEDLNAHDIIQLLSSTFWRNVLKGFLEMVVVVVFIR